MFWNLWSAVQKLSPQVESIIPNEGKLLFLGVLTLTRLDGAFFFSGNTKQYLRSAWCSVLGVAKILLEEELRGCSEFWGEDRTRKFEHVLPRMQPGRLTLMQSIGGIQ